MQLRIVSPGDFLLKWINSKITWADETRILAALVSDAGVAQFIRSMKTALRQGKRIVFIFGRSMLSYTSADAIEKLFQLHDNDKFKLLVYTGSSFFHPKLIAFRKKNTYSFIIGSSNFTEQGMRNNIEFNCLIDDAGPKDIVMLKNYIAEYDTVIKESVPITLKWIDEYRKSCKKLQRSFRNTERISTNVGNKLTQREVIDEKRWDVLVNKLRKNIGTRRYMGRLEYIKKARPYLKRSIGNPRNPHVKIEQWKDKYGYLSNLDQRNYIRTTPKNRQQQKRLNRTLKYLLDNNIPLEERLQNVLSPRKKYHIKGMGLSHVTDILNCFYPEKYILLNQPVIKAFKHFAVAHFPTDQAQCYMRALTLYSRLRSEAGYNKKTGFALIDQFMWDKGHKLIYGWN